MKTYNVETSSLGRLLFRLAVWALVLAMGAFLALLIRAHFVAAFFVAGAFCLLALLFGLLGLCHDSRKVRRGELKWDRPESEGGLPGADQHLPGDGAEPRRD